MNFGMDMGMDGHRDEFIMRVYRRASTRTRIRGGGMCMLTLTTSEPLVVLV